MRRALIAALLFASLTPAARAEDERDKREEKREEREREEKRERREREEKGDHAEKGKARAGDDEVLYAMGAILGSRVHGHGLSAKELEKVKRGFADAAAGRKLKLRDPDLDEWGPKVDALLTRRNLPKLAGEKERGAAFAKSAAKEEGAKALPSGVVFRTLKPGEGAHPQKTDRVRVSYEGRLVDGTVFDSSASHGGPAELRLDKVIKCWSEGVPQMQIGEKARLVCPASQAYGDQGRPPQIPGGATLVFDIELLGLAQ